MSATAVRSLRTSRGDEAKKMLLDKLGDLSSISVMHNRILVAIYIRPEKTASGLFIPDKSRDEDRYQGKVGLVVKIGPRAFQDDERVKFHGQNIKVGDWVYYHVADGRDLRVNGVDCRLFAYETQIIGVVEDPESVW